MRPQVTIQTEDFDVSQEIDFLREQDLRVGAVCSFVGTVRDTRALTGQAADEVQAMELEHYPGMTEKAIEAMIDAAQQRFDITFANHVFVATTAAAIHEEFHQRIVVWAVKTNTWVGQAKDPAGGFQMQHMRCQ